LDFNSAFKGLIYDNNDDDDVPKELKSMCTKGTVASYYASTRTKTLKSTVLPQVEGKGSKRNRSASLASA
jgi:hypothetical protein